MRTIAMASFPIGAVLLALSVARPAAAQSAFQPRDVNPSGDALPAELTHVNGALLGPGQLFFVAEDGVHGRELWKSDGTEAGMLLVKDINGTAASSNPANLTRLAGALLAAGRLFFTALGPFGVELSATDLLFKGGAEQGP